jgi:hypothetical protein
MTYISFVDLIDADFERDDDEYVLDSGSNIFGFFLIRVLRRTGVVSE